jgi:hypothetical protein
VQLVIYFLDAQANAKVPIAHMRQKYPNARFVGCSAKGAIFQGDVYRDNLVCSGLAFDSTRTRLCAQEINAGDPADVGEELAERLNAPDLLGVLLFIPPYLHHVPALIAAMQAVIGAHIPISGGVAGATLGRHTDAFVGMDDWQSQNHVVAVGFYGRNMQITVGTNSGMRPFGPERTITSVDGPYVLSLDGRPALALYQKYLGEDAVDLPKSASFFPLGVWLSQASTDEMVIRSVLGVDVARQALLFDDNLTTGMKARLLRGSAAQLVDGAVMAAEDAICQQQGQNKMPQGFALVISCIGRRVMMGERTGDEIAAVMDALGANVAVGGFYSMGEIGPLRAGAPSCFHNETMTIFLIQETPCTDC